MTSKPEHSVDERLTGAHDLALAALAEITPVDTVGPAAAYTAEDDGVVSLRFHTRLSGYPGWFWTVSVAVVEDSEPTVLEVELLPGDGALLAPDWVPWATRLAEYQAAQAAAAAADDDEDADDDDDADDLDDESDDEDEDDDDEPKARFHAGDLDGVDIDELDADHAGDADEDSDDDSDAEEADDDADDADDSYDAEGDDDADADHTDENGDESDLDDDDRDEGDRSY